MCRGRKKARRDAPDLRSALFLTRTLSGIALKLTLATACAAIVLAVTVSVWLTRTAGHTNGPARAVAAAGAGVHRAGVLGTGTGLAIPASLAAATTPLSRTPHQIARHMLIHHFRWKAWQFKYLDRLWTLESGWNRYATNPYSGAYGIPQAFPGQKMASAGPNWRSSARTQIRWGMRYIKERYGTPYWAWQNERRYSWY